MKYFIDGVLIVEGANDESYLSSFIDAMYVVTNGYEIPKEELDFVKECSKTKKVIILTDSDEAGMKIREQLNVHIAHAYNPIVNINKCNKNGKHGVKECEKEEIIRVLQGFFENKPVKRDLNYKQIGLDEEGKNNRELLIQKLHLGKCNNKKLIKRLNFLGIKEETVEEIIKNGN